MGVFSEDVATLQMIYYSVVTPQSQTCNIPATVMQCTAHTNRQLVVTTSVILMQQNT